MQVERKYPDQLLPAYTELILRNLSLKFLSLLPLQPILQDSTARLGPTHCGV